MNTSDLKAGEYPDYYKTYVDLLPDKDLIELLENQKKDFTRFLKNLSSDDLGKSYASKKWTVAEVLQHMFDTERIFQYRALTMARKDQISLPGYDQDAYVPVSRANRRSLPDLIEDYIAVRNSTISLFKSLDEEMLRTSGISNQKPLTPLAAGFIICGHEKHHLNLFQTKYDL